MQYTRLKEESQWVVCSRNGKRVRVTKCKKDAGSISQEARDVRRLPEKEMCVRLAGQQASMDLSYKAGQVEDLLGEQWIQINARAAAS